jgi:hypothetical protein
MMTRSARISSHADAANAGEAKHVERVVTTNERAPSLPNEGARARTLRPEWVVGSVGELGHHLLGHVVVELHRG